MMKCPVTADSRLRTIPMRGKIAAAIGLAMAATAVAVIVTGTTDHPARVMRVSGPRAGTEARFILLARRDSNRCSLRPADLMSYQAGRRLQGSCCAAMNRARYVHQVASLSRYAGITQIPADPYDIPAGLAQRLIRYQQTIRLTPAQQGIYRTAMRLTPEHGPCCCHCWRWTAFHGLSDYLIAQRHWQARQLATLIGDLNGCGGSG